MPGLDVAALPLWGLLLAFAAAAAVVWFAGVRITRHAGTISERTGAGDALVGVVLLGLVTSLPEIAASVTGAMRGEAALAANNMLGGLAFQVAILAVADAFVGREALTSTVAEPGVLLQATLNLVLLTLVAAGIVAGEVALPGGIGAWSLSLVAAYLLSVWLIADFRDRRTWHPADHDRPRGAVDSRDEDAAEAGDMARKPDGVEGGEGGEGSLRRSVLWVAGLALVVLAAGYLLTLSAEGIARETGLGTSFVGAVLLAAGTSLPELSTSIAAVRMRRYSLALGDVFGTNLVDVALIFLVDAVYQGPPVLGELGAFSVFAALAGTMTTIVYVVGLLERRDRTVARIGVDSIVVLLVYLGGLAVLYRLR